MSCDHWEPCQPRFVMSVLWVMIALLALLALVGVIWTRALLGGMLAGGVLAIALYLLALLAARMAANKRGYTGIMLVLLLSQAILWIVMGIFIVAYKVDGVGFVIGNSIIPSGIILTLLYYLIARRLSPSCKIG